jgi:hypothetical protein
VPWSGIVVRQHPTVKHSLVLWLAPGARPHVPSGGRPHEYGALRLIFVEGSRLNTTAAQLDRVIAHHADHRYSCT